MVRYGLTRLKDRLVESGKAGNVKEVTASVEEVDSQFANEPQNTTDPTPASQFDPRAFRDGYEARPGDVFIAIMGVTGAGKSTLISKCTEKQVRIGHDLQACTQEVAVFLCKYSDTINVYLVDTPGFDDTDRSDTEILTEIASWLTASYSNSIKLHGIIYLHRITDHRMQGAARRNLHMFQKLCGTKALNNVVLATTMWEQVREEDGVERERQLRVTKDFWGYMVDNGSTILRHHNDRASAIRLLERLIGREAARPKVVLDIQAQMVDDGKTLADTSAGQAVDDGITKERKRFAKQIEQTQAGMQEALQSRDREAADMLQQHRREMDERVKRLDSEHSALKVSLERLQEQRFAKMKQALEDAELENKRAREAMEQARLDQEMRQKKLEDELRARDILVAAQKRHMADLQARAEVAHKLEMAELEERLSKVSAVKLRTRSHPGVNTMSTWSVSISLWAERLFFVAYVTDMANVQDNFPAARLTANNGNRYITLGEGDAYYIHYHDAAGKCWTERSLEFRTRYAGAENYMSTYEQYNCPTCVSLGQNSQYFIRTAWGCSYEIPDDAQAHLTDMSAVENFWFGKDGAWVATKFDGSRSWDLKGGYPGLGEKIRDGVNGETRTKLVAMNPEDETQWVVLWKNGLAAYHIGEKNVFDSFELEEWCTKNFGTVWRS